MKTLINPSDQLSLLFEEPAKLLYMPEPEAQLKTCDVIPFQTPEPDPVRGEEISKQIIELFDGLRYKHAIWDVFSDFCALSALSISNSVDKRKSQWEPREQEYLRVVGKYERKEVDLFPKIFGLLADALEYYGPKDVLGDIFQQLEITNKNTGQFFTPQHISDLMGELQFTPDLGEVISKQGYVTLHEPAVGGGSLVFGFCKAMAKAGFNYQRQLHVTAIDLDLRCAQMAYIQMTLLGIPGVVYHGNTLSLEMYSSWCTPLHILHGWFWRGAGRLVQSAESAV